MWIFWCLVSFYVAAIAVEFAIVWWQTRDPPGDVSGGS